MKKLIVIVFALGGPICQYFFSANEFIRFAVRGNSVKCKLQYGDSPGKYNKGPTIYDVRTEGGGGVSPKEDVAREVA